MWHKIKTQFYLIEFSLSVGFKYIYRYRCMILLFLSFVILRFFFFPKNQIILRLLGPFIGVILTFHSKCVIKFENIQSESDLNSAIL